MSAGEVGKTREALSVAIAGWAAETLLSGLVGALVRGAAPDASVVALLTSAGALFVPATLALALGSGLLARVGQARAAGIAGAALYAAHAALITAQMLSPVLFGGLARDDYARSTSTLGGALAIGRLLAWGALAMAAQAASAATPRAKAVLTLAYGASAAVAVVNVFFPRADPAWSTTTMLVNLSSNAAFLWFLWSLRARAERAPAPAAPRNRARVVAGWAFFSRAALLFVVAMLGASAGGAGVVIASALSPVLSAALGLVLAASIGWDARGRSGPCGALLKASAVLVMVALAIDAATSASLLASLAREGKRPAPAFGGVGFVVFVGAFLAWVRALTPGAPRLSRTLQVLGSAYLVASLVALTNLSDATSAALFLATNGWFGLVLATGAAWLAWTASAPESAPA